MKTKAAVLTGLHQEYQVREIDVAEPRAGEALVRMKVSGLCHSDEHNKCGGTSLPIVGGHEGSGVVEAVGPGVTRLEVGDHVGVSWIPSCGRCRWCVTGHSNLCDLGANLATGVLANGGLRYSMDGVPIGGIAATGTFSQFLVADERSLVKVDKDIPLEWVSLVTCGVTTGWGSVVNAGQVREGDVVAIYGCGGIGSSAVQAAVNSGAQTVAAVDPVAMKLEFAQKLGADRTYDNAADAHTDILALTCGVGADVAVVTVGKVTSEVVRAAFDITRKGGTVVLTGVSDYYDDNTIELPGTWLTLFQKKLVGTLYGNCNPHVDIPRLLGLAKRGKLRLDDFITRRYTLDQINQGYADLLAGHNIRGVILHDD
ncbi:alcohol dehydrogenase [Mycobacterium aquaticum]|uniref:alcohol dehydrogenase n=2 Tax=Mycobacterium aquaticum TaxID=1927124 RepID=A0A1X0A8N4_9MYCO|nr:NDMA-dependent alcohol dehydrogenase [Mycobacterium aquaticum]ORA26275.1 alcohol dehydrogenase [Mycobacterium aquaticum]